MGVAASLLPSIIPAALMGLAQIFGGSPTPANNTVRRIEAHHHAEPHPAAVESARRRAAAAADAAQTQSTAADDALARQRAAEASEAAALDRARSLAREATEAYTREARATSAISDAQRATSAALARASAAESSAAQAATREAAATAAAHTAATQLAALQTQLTTLHTQHNRLSSGIAPTVWPSPAELAAAKARINYDPARLHLAVCGPAGAGKSSLVNAFLGTNAAPTGVVETTRQIMAYPDPDPRMVTTWFDIPGAGTLGQPSWQYFISQGLFVFDVVVMVYDTRFTEVDAQILRHCARFGVPVFVVRSKSDMHIDNMVKDTEDDGPAGRMGRAECRERYVQETRRDFKRNLRLMAAGEDGADPTAVTAERKVYVVSARLVKRVVKKRTLGEDKVDEEGLVRDLVTAVAERRFLNREGEGEGEEEEEEEWAEARGS